MIKILHIGFSINPGGVESMVMNYYRHIDRGLFSFSFLDLYGEGIAFKEEICSLGGKIYTLPNYKKRPLSAAKQLDFILNSERYHIIHIHMQSAANLMPVIIALKSGKAIVIAHSHSSSTPKGLGRKILNKINMNVLRNLNVQKWACGMAAGEWMWGNSFKPENIIVNAVPYNQFCCDGSIRKAIRENCNLCDDDKVIGFVGRFGEEKNTFFLIKVLLELKKISDKYKLLTVGGNDMYSEFVKKIEKYGLKDCYYSAGIQTSVQNWYQAMDAFLLPSFLRAFLWLP